MQGAARFMMLVGCAGFLCAAAPAAHGQIFESAQQFWLNESRARAGLGWGAPYGREVDGPRRDREAYRPRPDVAPNASAPQVEVKSPQYYNYRADTLEALQVDQLCEVKMASSGTVSDTTLSFAAACALLPSVSLRVLPEVGAALTAYYQKHSQFIWIDSGNVAEKAKAVIAEMSSADSVGLIPDDYRVELPKLDAVKGQDVLKEALRFELALSAKALTYVLDATRGRVDPNRISGYHDLPRKKVDLAAALQDLAHTELPAGYLAGRHPTSAAFRALAAELGSLSRDVTPRVTLPPGLTIKPGQTHPALTDVIAAIAAASPTVKRKYAEAIAGAGAAYSGDLVLLMRAFQIENGLRPDGIVGPNTIGALKRDTAAAKVRKVQLAMERLRWLPHDLGERYVWLNQPTYRVSIIDDGKEELSMPVIIGKTSNQTNFFTDKIQAVEYNPSWTVPRSIIVNEMVPKLYRDPTYLDRIGYQVTNHRGQPVSSASVAWDRVALNKASVEVRQPPGPRNALGRLKIEFPNRHAIYMHDTPQKSLFKQGKRAFSHGCVRLEQPALMAAALLGKPVGHVNARVTAGKNAVEPVSRQIPVYLAYFTAWPDKDGKIAYFGDVYERDTYLMRAIETTNAVRTAAR